MTISPTYRFMCCLLAALLLFTFVSRPLEVSATGLEAATAGIVGLAPEVAIPIILVLLGISVVAANWDDICDWVDGAYDSVVTWINDDELVPAYNYNGQIYVPDDVVSSVKSSVNTYYGLKYDDAWQLGKQFSKMYTVEFSSATNNREFVVFSDSAPYTQTVGGSKQFVVRKPCVIYNKAYGSSEIIDYTGSTGTEIWEFQGTTITGFDTSLTENIVSPVIDVAPIVTVHTPDGEEEKVIPIAPSTDIPYEDTNTDVVVDPEVETGNPTIDLSGVTSWLKSIWTAITQLASQIVTPIVDVINSVITRITTATNAIIQQLGNAIASVRTAITTGVTTITDAITKTIADIIEWLKSMGATLADILEWIKTLPASIAQAISIVITDVFVPSADFISEKVDSITSRFAWIAPLVDIAKGLSVDLSSSTPPVVYVHMENSESDFIKGETVKFIDMTWYARYKPYGDTILSGFLWALFAWRMYLKIPGIINGVGGSVGHIASSGGYRRKDDGE